MQPSLIAKILVVFDSVEQLPLEYGQLIQFLKNSNTHVIIILKHDASPQVLQRQIGHHLCRACHFIDVKPLTKVNRTQRIAYALVKEYDLAPQTEHQKMLSNLADLTLGSPDIISVAIAFLLTHLRDGTDLRMSLSSFSEKHRLISVGSLLQHICSKAGHNHLQCTSASCTMSVEERFALFCLSLFGCTPVPLTLVIELCSFIGRASRMHNSGNVLPKLLELSLVKPYPMPVVLHSSVHASSTEGLEPPFVYTPQLLSQAVRTDVMTLTDKEFALATTCKALKHAGNQLEQNMLIGLCAQLLEVFEPLVSDGQVSSEYYEEAVQLYHQIKETNDCT